MLNKLYKKIVSSSKQSTSELLHTTDLHSHLLPAIDDGSQNMEQSIELLKKFEKLGFKKLITTPHIMSHRFPNKRKTIYENYNLLIDEMKKEKVNIELQVAAEYYYDEYFVKLIENKKLLTFGDNYILFEFSYHNKPFALEQTIYNLLKEGYKPVLAHPERYTFYTTKEDYQRLKDLGLFFQINLISTQGFYGKSVKKSVDIIIQNAMVDFIGSDVHNQKYVDSFSLSLKSKIYSKIMKTNQIKNSLL